MPIQIIQRQQPKQQSTGERFSQAMKQGMEQVDKYQQKQRTEKALVDRGFDPSVADLPKEALSEYFKNEFATEKGLNPLQLSQKNLYDAKLRDLEETQSFENRLKGNSSQSNSSQSNSNQSDSNQSDSSQSDLSQNNSSKNLDMSKEELDHYEGYAGQPGKRGVIGNIAKNKREKEEKDQVVEQKRYEADREFHTKVSRPIIQKANETLKSSEINKGLRKQLRRDISSGNTSGLFPYMVDKMGLESFRNPTSARFTNEVKHLFIDSVSDIPGVRPNVFLERMLSAAQPMIGRDEESNNSVLDVDDFVQDVRLEQAKKELEIAKDDREKFGYVKEDVTERARDLMGDFVNRRQETMALDIRNRSEVKMKDADILNEIIGETMTPGTYVTPRTMNLLWVKNGKDLKKAVKEAESLKMVFPEYMEN